MHKPTVVLARVLAFIPIQEILPGTVFVTDLLNAIGEKYRFQKYPTKRDEMIVKEGIEFVDGMSGKTCIERLVIWDQTLVLETRVSTDASKEVLESILGWATSKFDLSYRSGDIKRFAYISDISFESDAKLLYIDPVLSWLSEQASAALTTIWQEPVEYRPTSIKVGHDPVLRQAGIAPFSIERRGLSRFADNKYYSEAPLPTALHLSLLEQFEKKVLYESNVKAYGSGKTER